ncbi:MAG: YceI family protein [Flavobacterium sp.]|nr:YceI family protein [Flavobacterium sp.]
MKKIALLLIALVTVQATQAQLKKIKPLASSIQWTGKKVTGQHEGTINFLDGFLTFKSNKLVAGTFTVDMKSISTTDLTGEYKDKLDGHLKADDFFGVEKFPTATLLFKKVTPVKANTYTVVADLTIKGKMNPVTFTLVTSATGATADVKINRAKYDVQYGSETFLGSLGDKAIYDDFDLKIKLVY